MGHRCDAACEALACHAGIPCQSAGSRISCSTSDPAPNVPGEAAREMEQVLGTLPPARETWTELLAPSLFRPALAVAVI